MILTCPACSTQYVVKDGAIPPAGRQVRCAACKHSWHQDPEAAPVGDDVMTPGVDDDQPPRSVEDTFDGPPMAESDVQQPPLAEAPGDERPEDRIVDYPEPKVADATTGNLGAAGYGLTAPVIDAPEALAQSVAEEPATEWSMVDQAMADEDFGIPDMVDDEAPRGRGLRMVLMLLLLVAIVAAAFWFLAPPELKARFGIAESGATPLEVMLTTSDRQKLASGNELLAISGRVINPTDREVAVPPIRASLRNKATRKLVYQWTIAPPARSLGPRASASFNSAEVDIPEGGDELTVSLGDAAT
jgi:predicted Zn finger-like uncharacterized protein